MGPGFRQDDDADGSRFDEIYFATTLHLVTMASLISPASLAQVTSSTFTEMALPALYCIMQIVSVPPRIAVSPTEMA